MRQRRAGLRRVRVSDRGLTYVLRVISPRQKIIIHIDHKAIAVAGENAFSFSLRPAQLWIEVRASNCNCELDSLELYL